MLKLTNGSLAAIVTAILTKPETGEVDSLETFQQFMTDLAQVLCDYCGGEIETPPRHIGGQDFASSYEMFITDINEKPRLHDLLAAWAPAQDSTQATLEHQYGHEHPTYTREDWREDVRMGDTLRGYWDWVLSNMEMDADDSSGLNCDAAGECSKRSIFEEALMASFISVSASKRVPLRARNCILAQVVLETYPRDTEISRELYDADTMLRECLISMSQCFEFPSWEGRTLGEYLRRCGATFEGSVNVLQYERKTMNADGIHADFITLAQLEDAQPLGDTGWLLPSGLEIWFH